jgi:hypothetical protein
MEATGRAVMALNVSALERLLHHKWIRGHQRGHDVRYLRFDPAKAPGRQWPLYGLL